MRHRGLDGDLFEQFLEVRIIKQMIPCVQAGETFAVVSANYTSGCIDFYRNPHDDTPEVTLSMTLTFTESKP